MKRLFFVVLVIFSTLGNAQPPLEFIEIGYEPAYCRLFSYQTGNGSVYAAATGGTPDYIYNWKNLDTGEEVPNTTWGGLNPACYEITVTDALGWTLVDTVCLDSINPTAIIGVDEDLIPTTDGYVGFGGQYVTLTNESTGFCNPYNPLCDSIFWWNTDKGYGWTLHTGEDFFEPKEPWYGPGEYNVGLLIQNKNGCADTTWIKIGIFAPVGTAEEEAQSAYLFHSSSDDQLLRVELFGSPKNVRLTVYDLGGKLILTQALLSSKNDVPFNEQEGIYVYSLSDPVTGEELGSGKFTY